MRWRQFDALTELRVALHIGTSARDVDIFYRRYERQRVQYFVNRTDGITIPHLARNVGQNGQFYGHSGGGDYGVVDRAEYRQTVAARYAGSLGNQNGAVPCNKSEADGTPSTGRRQTLDGHQTRDVIEDWRGAELVEHLPHTRIKAVHK